jgi:Ca2+-binding EF-hand superfamily protein
MSQNDWNRGAARKSRVGAPTPPRHLAGFRMPPKRRAGSAVGGDAGGGFGGTPSPITSPSGMGMPSIAGSRRRPDPAAVSSAGVAQCLSPERTQRASSPVAPRGGVAELLSPERSQRASSPSDPGAARRRYERGRHAGLQSKAECPENAGSTGAAGAAASDSHLRSRYHNGERGTESMQHVSPSSRTEQGALRSEHATRSPGRRPAAPSHASEGVARLLSPEKDRASSPPPAQRESPSRRRYERGHHEGLASGAECPEHKSVAGTAGGSSSNHHELTRYHNGEHGSQRLQHVDPVRPTTLTEDGALRQAKATRSPGRKRLSPPPSSNAAATTKTAGALLPHFVGEKIEEMPDGWCAYREARPGGGVEVSWRRTTNAAHTDDHAAGTAFNTSHTNMSLADVVRGTGDGCISSFDVGPPKWAQVGMSDTDRLQLSAFSRDASDQESGSPRSVFARRRAAAEIEYGEWHREQSRREQSRTKSGPRGPPPTPQQWLQQRIREAKTIPAVTSVLEPRELDEFMQQMAESTIDELEVHNAEFSDKITRGNVVPQELRAWEFLQQFAQGCIQREVAKLDTIARAKTGPAVSPVLPTKTPAALHTPLPPWTPHPEMDSTLQTDNDRAVEDIDAVFQAALDAVPPEEREQDFGADPVSEEPDGMVTVESEPVVIPEVPDKATRKEMFEGIDVNGNGVLSLGEIQMGIERLYPEINHRPAMLRAYKAADVNGDGFIGRREFRLFLEYLVFFSQAWMDFEAFDIDSDHRLTESEFVAGCQRLGLDYSAEEAAREFQVVDQNNGGYVLFEEFCCWAGQAKIGVTKQLWPKYKTAAPVIPPEQDDASVDETDAPRQKKNRHARVMSPEKGGRLAKPNRIWVNNKWQDSPQTAAVTGMDRRADRVISPVRSARLTSPLRPTSQQAAAADSAEPMDAAAPLLISPERTKPAHLLTSPERRTLRNRESARQDPGSAERVTGVDDSLAVSLTGVWRAKGERRDGTRVEQSIYIRHEQDGRVTGGHVDGINGFFVIKNGTVDGSTVWFRQEYSSGNRVVWKATIEQTYLSGSSGIKVPKLIDGTWNGNMQGSFSATLETMQLSPAEAAGTVARKHSKKPTSSSRTGSTTSDQQMQRQKSKVVAPADDVEDDLAAARIVDSAVPTVEDVLVPPQAPLAVHTGDLSGSWHASGTQNGKPTEEMFVLVHDVAGSGGIHGHSLRTEGEVEEEEAEDENAFEIIDGKLEGGTLRFVQKFHDGVETMW